MPRLAAKTLSLKDAAVSSPFPNSSPPMPCAQAEGRAGDPLKGQERDASPCPTLCLSHSGLLLEGLAWGRFWDLEVSLTHIQILNAFYNPGHAQQASRCLVSTCKMHGQVSE